jgi:hypothetical protein
MKFEPITTARAPLRARPISARASPSERSRWTLPAEKPGIGSATGSAPVASSRRSKASVSPPTVTVRAAGSSRETGDDSRSSIRCAR